MFPPSVAGGTICLGCQLRAVTRRAAPVLAAASHTHSQTRISNGSGGSRRQYASRASRKKEPVDELVAVLSQQTHQEGSKNTKPSNKRRSAPQDDWDLEPAAPNKHTKKSRPDEAAALLRRNSYNEGPRRRQASGAWPKDDWDLPATPKEHTGPATAENTPHDDIAATVGNLEEQDVVYRDSLKSTSAPETEREPDQALEEEDNTRTETGHSRGGAALPEDFEDDELNVQQSSRYSHRPAIHRRGGDRALSDETAKHRAPNTYRKGRTKLVEVVPKLSVKTLGKAAEVIVLKEGGDWFTKPFREDERPLDQGLSLEDYADQEKGLSLDEVVENIDGLRPEHRNLSSKEFKDVFDSLWKGFTSFQLENYVERYLLRLDEGDETPFLGPTPEMAKSRPWIMKQSVWTPEVKGAVEEVDYPLKGYILKSMRPKQRLVMQLMRECWGMSVQELMDGQGVLEVRVRDREFKLLTCKSCLTTRYVAQALKLT